MAVWPKFEEPLELGPPVPLPVIAQVAESCEAERYLSKLAGLDQLAEHLELLCQRALW